jgi:hypothetical protein
MCPETPDLPDGVRVETVRKRETSGTTPGFLRETLAIH